VIVQGLRFESSLVEDSPSAVAPGNYRETKPSRVRGAVPATGAPAPYISSPRMSRGTRFTLLAQAEGCVDVSDGGIGIDGRQNQ
jgi:hypothetical protein